jgi:hypothetical protein
MDDAAETLSDDPHQKLCAVVALVNSRRDALPDMYLMSCERWYFTLMDPEKLVAIHAAQTLDLGDRKRPLQIVAALPPVPRL